MKRMLAVFNVPDDNTKHDVALDLDRMWDSATTDATVYESEEDYLADLADLARAKADEVDAQVELLGRVRAAYRGGHISKDEAFVLLCDAGLA